MSEHLAISWALLLALPPSLVLALVIAGVAHLAWRRRPIFLRMFGWTLLIVDLAIGIWLATISLGGWRL
jgi:hypothetical protein